MTMHRGFTNFEITVACGLKFHWYLRTLSLKFQKATSKIEVFLSLPSWLSRLNREPTGQRQEIFNGKMNKNFLDRWIFFLPAINATVFRSLLP